MYSLGYGDIFDVQPIVTTGNTFFLHEDWGETKSRAELSKYEDSPSIPTGTLIDLVLSDNTPCYCELSLKAPWKPWSDLYDPSIPCGLSALLFSGLAVMDGRGTFNLLRIVDDEIAVPYDGEVHCQVTDLHTLVHVLKSRKKRVRECALSGSRARK